MLQGVEPGETGTRSVQYGKVESWEKRKREYHVILDSGESIFSPILGSCDVHIIGDSEVQNVEKKSNIPNAGNEEITEISHHQVI